MPDYLAAIRVQRKAVDDEIARHHEALETLEKRRGELEIAERIVSGLEEQLQLRQRGMTVVAGDGADYGADYIIQNAAGQTVAGIQVKSRRGRPPGPPKEKKKLPPKPEGLPTYPEMIEDAVLMASNHGFLGLEPAEIILYIQKRYWPKMPQEKAAPIISYLWSHGRLKKYGTMYAPESSVSGIEDAIAETWTEPEALEQRARRREWVNSIVPAKTLTSDHAS
jgi:hypothetical protein